MTTRYDAIVVGAGHNGLTCAAYLARAGQRVLVLEARGAVGGALATEEFAPGFRADVMPRGTGWLNPRLVHDLRLNLEFIRPEAAVFSPLPDGGGLTLWRSPARTVEALRRLSPADADRFLAFGAHVAGITRALESLYVLPAPDIHGASWGSLMRYLPPALRVRRMGRRRMQALLRTLPMSAYEFLNEWFETPALKGALGAAGVTGVMQGVRGAGTALLFLHQHVGAAQGAFRAVTRVRGGIGKLSEALANSARAAGAEVRCGTRVAQMMVQDGRVTGVALADGEQIAARAVVSSADPRTTFLDLLDPVELDPSFANEVRTIRMRGVAAVVQLALDGLPAFDGADASQLGGVISISPDLDTLERAYDAAKYGAISERPLLEASIPTLADPSLAPEGRHVMTIWMQYAPYDLTGGWGDDQREALGDLVVRTLAEVAPDLPGRVLHRRVLAPPDLEREYGLPEGSFAHGEMALDQLLFMRPVPGWSGYDTPLGGLYLCGAGTHPGGGHTGAAGYVAARAILPRLKRG